MALFLEFLLTILLSLLFSFLLAKLFSVSSSSTNSDDDDGDHVSVLSPRKLMIEEVVVSDVVEADDFVESRREKIENQETLNDSYGSPNDFKIDENKVLGELCEGSSGKFGGASEFEDNLVGESTERENIAKIEEDFIKDVVDVAKCEEVVVSESECDNEILEANKNKEGGGVCDCEEILVDARAESERTNKIERELCKNVKGVAKSENETGEANKNKEVGVKEALFDEDDDWEGVERTELERLFGSAVAFVGSKSNADRISSVGSLVKMKLYGLHKIATQGPCHEPQPMALKVSARANWNAWKSFGNMTREEAMEQYVTILSKSIPGCIQDDTGDDSKQVSADSEACSKPPSDLMAWKMKKVGPVDERNVDELMPSFEGLDVSL
ncbi:hypothetical protein ACOSQ2_023613 [Xanthoceras sorbifolium]